jgi:hypothetical protein
MRNPCKDFGGICTMCDKEMKRAINATRHENVQSMENSVETCNCDPCQHGKTREQECVFCERIGVEDAKGNS